MSDNISQSVEFPNRINQAAKLMAITPETLRGYLQEMGVWDGGNDEASGAESLALLQADTTTEADAKEVMVTKGTVKIARFKAGWAVLKGKSQTQSQQVICEGSKSESDVATLVKALRSPAQYKDDELLKEYREDASTEIFDELNKRSNGRAFIIFKEDGQVDLEHSKKMLTIARRGETPATYVTLGTSENGGGRMVTLYRVGQFPKQFLEECPIHPDMFLVEGYCEECKLHWGGVSMDDRILVRIAVEMKAIDVSSTERVFDLLADLRNNKRERLTRIPAIAHRYEELKDEGRLPVLRRKLSKQPGKSDPFFVHKQH